MERHQRKLGIAELSFYHVWNVLPSQGAHIGSKTSAFGLLSLLGYGLVGLLSESRPSGPTPEHQIKI